MSTRSTLWYSEDFHLYAEALDDENVYLEVATEHVPELVIKIPLAAWKEMRQTTIQPAERYLDMSDKELRSEAEREVDEHRASLAKYGDSPIGRLAGVLVFGPPEQSREEMVESFLRFYRPQGQVP